MKYQISLPEDEEAIKEIKSELRTWVEQNIPSEFLQQSLELIEEFSFPYGQGWVSLLLVTAGGDGKIEKALSVLRQQFENHWKYRPPPIRGQFLTRQDEGYVQKAYNEIGIPLPN